jgi:hypothetical protein
VSAAHPDRHLTDRNTDRNTGRRDLGRVRDTSLVDVHR